MITPDVSSLSGTVFTRLEVTCNSPVEWAYYGTQMKGVKKDIRAYCVKDGTEIDAELKKCFKTVLPVCGLCKDLKKPLPKRGPLHTASAQRSIKSMLAKKAKK